jgi:type IV pilus assembly protein PilM
MMKFNHKKRSAIGIDIGSRIIKAAQLLPSGDHSRIAALTMLPRTASGASIEYEEVCQLKRVLHRQGFTGSNVVLAVPDQKLLRGTFELPPRLPKDKVPQMARMELSRIHQVAPQSFEMVCWIMPQSDQVKSITQTISVGCLHDVANAYLDVFEQGGLNVTALDVRSAAAARACEGLTVPMPALTAILDLGWGSTKLLLACGNTIIYERLLESPSLQALIARLSKRFNIADQAACHVIDAVGFAVGEVAGFDEQSTVAIRRLLEKHAGKMIEELKVPFAYANHQLPGEGIQRLLLIGGGAKIPGLAPYFESQIGMDVKEATPGELMESLPALQSKVDNPATTVAVGLARFSGV